MRTAMMAALVGAAFAALAGRAAAQADVPSKVPLVFNRYHTADELDRAMRDLAAAYPEIASLRRVGSSVGGRDMLVLVISATKTGPDTEKPAMWIDGGIHANEVQAAEVVLYTAWYLTKMYGVNPTLTSMIDERAFYLCAMVNPDARVAWFETPATPHNFRANLRPVDDDRDGLFDEDGPDDLDGDGAITTMWKKDPHGRWIRDKDDPRIFRRVAPDKAGEWTMLGEEGIDNDGDGRINEDGPGGDDMNRNFPGGWLPNYVQWGAGPYPLSAPETRAVADFIEARPNIAAAQAYHNTGGMILRGPGAEFRSSMYPAQDARVYEELAKTGEQLLPYYRSLVIWKDLYTVHGGFVNWTAESLGIFSFTNELWTVEKYFQRAPSSPNEEQQWLWRDRMLFGQAFSEYKPFNHPTHGEVLIGGPNQWSSRSTPTFMLEEECHRNFAFTVYHADQMPRVAFDAVEAAAMGGGLWEVTVTLRNDRLIPTRSEHARRNRIGANDVLWCEPEGRGRVVTSGRLSSRSDRRFDEVLNEPGRVQLDGGVPGRGVVHHRFIVEGERGTRVNLSFTSQKSRDASIHVVLGEAAGAAK
ncbi:MAG: peptidase M14 [Phycisphaeraceae bacterium]|nr:MAG: peptidase M14 [Phycisphaeraceae bacterium]